MILSTVSQALLLAVLGLGLFVTFRILNFPDMSTEWS
ncbi:ABC transporter permease, partial [Streptococcus suis]